MAYTQKVERKTLKTDFVYCYVYRFNTYLEKRLTVVVQRYSEETNFETDYSKNTEIFKNAINYTFYCKE